MNLYAGPCHVKMDALGRRCKKGTDGCIARHVRRPTAVVMAEEREAVVAKVLADWSTGSPAERNCADDLRAALDAVVVPR